MKELNVEQLKQVELDILRQVHKVCAENGIRYSLCGGTLLGAVRHGGYIPWDDDIDILMPRPDYEKFILYCKNNDTPFNLICNQTQPKYGYLFAKACSRETVIEEIYTNRKGAEYGVYIDIFPIDGLGESYAEAKKVYDKTEFRRELLVAANWKKYFRSKTHAWYYEPARFAFYLLSRFVSYTKSVNSIEKDCKSHGFENSSLAGCVCGAYRLKEIMDKSVFAELTTMTFEGEEFFVMKNYDSYLKALFGDYMQLPPEEKRVTHHTFRAYYKDGEGEL